MAVRYVVIGAGAIGGALGGLLHESGQEVVLVARGAHAAALREQGLTLVRPGGTTVHRVPVADRPDAVDLRPGDVLLLTVKTQDTLAALDAWADRPVAGGGTAGERLPVVCAQNGVVNERRALRRFSSVYGVCVIFPATHLSPGVVVAPGVPHPGALVLGRCPSGVDETSEALAADLTGAGVYARADPAVSAWKYAKLVNNLSNAVHALMHPDDADVTADLATRIIAEAAAAFDAAGIARVPDAELTALRTDHVKVQPIDGFPQGSSTWQSLTRASGAVETDYLNGEIVLLGREHGVPTPVNAAIQRWARAFARAKRPPRTLRATEIAGL